MFVEEMKAQNYACHYTCSEKKLIFWFKIVENINQRYGTENQG